MKTFLLVAVIGMAGVLFLGGSTPKADETRRYCNARFDYCIEYDREVLTRDASKNENSDGAIFATEDGSVQVRVFGAFNPMQLTVDELFAENFEALDRKSRLEIDYKTFLKTESGYSINLETPQKFIRQRLVRQSDRYLVLTVEVAKTHPELLARVMSTTRFVEPINL